jgi:hypothetical protein
MATSFSGGRSQEYPERTADHAQATGKLYHLWLRIECTIFCNLPEILPKVALNTKNQSINVF